jgi:ComF family protein
MIYHIKDRPSRSLISFFAEGLSERVNAILKDADLTADEVVLMPIPRSYRAKALSGSDQALFLARAVGERTGIAVSQAVGRRRSSHRQQKHLKNKERFENAKNAYFLRRSMLPNKKAVILVDDIVTTGATMSAVAKLLWRAGVRSVYCLAVCSHDSNRTADVAQPTFHI